jgi:hypothetical protein
MVNQESTRTSVGSEFITCGTIILLKIKADRILVRIADGFEISVTKNLHLHSLDEIRRLQNLWETSAGSKSQNALSDLVLPRYLHMPATL